MLAIFVFHNRTRHRFMNLFTFSRDFKHVDVYIYNVQFNMWIGFRTGRDGITYSLSNIEDSSKLINKLSEIKEINHIIGVQIRYRAYFPWIPLTIPMCNEFARMITGINVGFTWNPCNLYNKLLKYDGKRNYDIFFTWRREDGVFRR